MVSFLDFEGTDPVSAAREAADAITAARKDVERRGVKSFLFASASAEEFDQRAEFSEVPDILDEVADKYLGSPDQRAKLTATLRREFVATRDTYGRPLDCPWCGAEHETWEQREYHINSEHPTAGKPGLGDATNARCELCGEPLNALVRVHHHNDPETGEVARDLGSSDSKCQLCGEPLNGLVRVHYHNDSKTGVVAAFQVMGPNVRTYVHPKAGCSADGQEQVVDADQTALGAGPVCPHCQVRFSVKPEEKTGASDSCGDCPAGTKCVCTHDGCRCVKTATNVPTGGDINEDRFSRFSDVYRVELEKAVKEHPEEYVWPVDQVPVVHGRMMDAVRNGSYNKDSRAIKSTVKALGVKHTYSGIREWLTSSDENNPPVRSAHIKTAEIVECPTCEEEMEDTDPQCPNGHPNENEYFSRGPGRKRPYGASGLAVWQEHCPTCGSVKNKLDDNDEYNNPICPGCDPEGHAAAQTALDARAHAEYQSESYAERGPNVDNAGPPTSPFYEEDGRQQFDPHWHSYEGRSA